MSSFANPDHLATYAANAARLVPGLADLRKMAGILLAERAGPDAHILVLGAGGGLELTDFAAAHPLWRLTGVDPSAAMLDLARQTLGPLAARVLLQEGYVDTAPEGPFDGATCLLTLHFLPRDARLHTLIELRRRLRPGAPFIAAHHAIPPDDKRKWLTRFAAFGASNGLPQAQADAMIDGLATRLPTLSPDEDEALLHEAGFRDVALFYAALTFRGWVALA